MSKQKIKFTDFGSQLPSEGLLRPYRECHDLVVERLHLNEQATLLGQSLDAKFAVGGGNPAKRAWNNEQIDEYTYWLIETLTDVYHAIFLLIQTAWEDLQADFSLLGIYDEVRLFCEVLTEHYDVKFKRCIDGYKLTVTNVEKTDKLFKQKVYPVLSNPIKVGEIKFSEQERADAGLLTETRFFWLPMILKQCREIAKHDSIIKERITTVDRKLVEFVAKKASLASQSRHQSDSTKRMRSVKWENQRHYIGVRGGGYKSFLKELYTHSPALFTSLLNDDYNLYSEEVGVKPIEQMTNFLTQIQALDSSTPQVTRTQLEPRRVRRQKTKDVIKTAKNKKLG